MHRFLLPVAPFHGLPLKKTPAGSDSLQAFTINNR
jgi:hypothetical protein